MPDKPYPTLHEVIRHELVPNGCKCYAGYIEQADHLRDKIVEFLRQNLIEIPDFMVQDDSPVLHTELCDAYREGGYDEREPCDCSCHELKEMGLYHG